MNELIYTTRGWAWVVEYVNQQGNAMTHISKCAFGRLHTHAQCGLRLNGHLRPCPIRGHWRTRRESKCKRCALYAIPYPGKDGSK